MRCYVCNGTGNVYIGTSDSTTGTGYPWVYRREDCQRCYGTGDV